MKYHYQEGVVEKDKKGHPKTWLAFFVFFGIITYSGFAFATLSLNGWPLAQIDQTAKLVKNMKPGSGGDRLFIPVINLNTNAQSLATTGDPVTDNVSIKGKEFAIGLTPGALRDASPFFNLSKLKEGDEVFLDKAGVRYAYKVTSSQDEEEDAQVLTLQNGKVTKKAQAIGTIAWRNGTSELESL